MIRYVAFLRAINVAGQKLIKMEELARILSAAGFRNVGTYIQSGNVIFDSRSANSTMLKKKVEMALKKALGYDLTVMVRPLAEIEEMVKRNPFKKIKVGADVMLFVVFLSDDPQTRPKSPLTSTAENLEVFEVRDRAAFILSRRKKNGWFGFPNKFVEKELGVPGTARNWSTVNKILKAAARTEVD